MSDKCEPIKLKPGEIVRIGNDIYGHCVNCHRLVKVTGFWKGVHICP